MLRTILILMLTPCFVSADTVIMSSLSRETQKRFRISISPEYFTVRDQEESSISGIGLGIGALFAIHKYWALGAGARQVFNSSPNLSAFLSVIELNLTYAITGSLIRREKMISIDDYPIVQLEKSYHGGLRTHLFLAQYFFHTTSLTLPYSGAGAALSYDVPLGRSQSFAFGLRLDRIANGGRILWPLQVFGAMLIWL